MHSLPQTDGSEQLNRYSRARCCYDVAELTIENGSASYLGANSIVRRRVNAPKNAHNPDALILYLKSLQQVGDVNRWRFPWGRRAPHRLKLPTRGGRRGSITHFARDRKAFCHTRLR